MTLSVAPGLSRAYTFVLQLTVLISLAALAILIADVQLNHGAIGNETLARTLAKVGAQEVSGALLRARVVLADISATPLPILLKSCDPCASALAGHLVGRGDFSNLFLMTASGAVKTS